MTALGGLILMCWIPAAGFLAVHIRAMTTAKRWNGVSRLVSWAVLIMATVVFLVLTLSMARASFGIVLPDWIRGVAYVLILIGVWVKFLGILYVRYGPPAKEDQNGAQL